MPESCFDVLFFFDTTISDVSAASDSDSGVWASDIFPSVRTMLIYLALMTLSLSLSIYLFIDLLPPYFFSVCLSSYSHTVMNISILTLSITLSLSLSISMHLSFFFSHKYHGMSKHWLNPFALQPLREG